MVLKVLRECLDIEFEVDLVQSYLYWEACFARPNQYCMFPARLPDFSNLFYSSFSSVQKRKYKKSCFGSDAPGYESQHKTMRPGFITRLIPVDFFISTKLGGLIPTGRFDTSQVPARGKSVGLALQYHYMIHRVGRVKDFITHLADISRKECD